MFDWEKKLKELKDYDISLEIKQGYYHISLVYNDTWEILVPENELIYIEQRNGVCHYIGSIDSVKMEDMFTAISTTIDYNIDLQNKLSLFRQKTEELQDIFSKEDYETLQTIKFVYGKEEKNECIKEPKKRGRKTKKKDEIVKQKKKENDKHICETNEKEKQTTEETTVEEENYVSPNYEQDEIVEVSEGFFEEMERE